MVGQSGRLVMYDSETNEVVSKLVPEEHSKLFTPFTDELANAYANLIAQGYSKKKACNLLNISEATISQWRMDSPDFCTLLDHAKSNRAEFIHESEYEQSIEYIRSVDPTRLSEEDLALFNKHLDTIKKKTKLLSNFKKQDAPSKFGGKAEQKVGTLSLNQLNFNAKLSPEAEEMIKTQFMPKITPEGGVDLEDTAADLEKFNVS